jgi:hypothetical protein
MLAGVAINASSQNRPSIIMMMRMMRIRPIVPDGK